MQLVWAIFRSPSTGTLIVIGNIGGTSPLQIVAVADPTGPSPSPTYLGDLPCVYCTDFAWDTDAEVLYAISNEESQTSSGSLLGVTVGSSPPKLVVNVTLEASLFQGVAATRVRANHPTSRRASVGRLRVPPVRRADGSPLWPHPCAGHRGRPIRSKFHAAVWVQVAHTPRSKRMRLPRDSPALLQPRRPEPTLTMSRATERCLAATMPFLRPAQR